MKHHNDTQGWEERFNEFSTGKTWESNDFVVLATPEQIKSFIRTELQRAREEVLEECQIKQEEREDMFWLALSKLSPDKPYAIDCRYHNAMPMVDGVCPRCPSVRYTGLTDLKNKK